MPNYKLTNKALEDLSKIWDYTFEVWSENQADRYYFMLLETCEDLANKKLHGKNYNEVTAELLGFRAGQHIIFYRHLKGYIEVARILHARMDLKNRIQE
jgi:toxin ParE1/3/4